MKCLIGLYSFILFTLFTVCAYAFTPPPVPTEGYIVDNAGKLTTSELASLNAKIDAVKNATTNEIGILLLQSLDGESIEDVAHDTFKVWKIGKAGLDNGVLVVLAIKNRKIRIQTGKGVEGDLTDLQANDIIAKMKPSLRKSDFSGALGIAIDNIGTTIESRKKSQVAPAANTSSSDSNLGLLLIGIPVIGGLLLGLFLWFKSKKETRSYNRYSSYTPPAPTTTTYTPPTYSSYTPSYSGSVSTPKTTTKSSSSSPKKSSSSYSGSSSSSSSWSSGGSSYDSGSSSGGGFSGGDSGGGGSSGDW